MGEIRVYSCSALIYSHAVLPQYSLKVDENPLPLEGK